jgi:hypothetical protein
VWNILTPLTCTLSRACPGHPCFNLTNDIHGSRQSRSNEQPDGEWTHWHFGQVGAHSLSDPGAHGVLFAACVCLEMQADDFRQRAGAARFAWSDATLARAASKRRRAAPRRRARVQQSAHPHRNQKRIRGFNRASSAYPHAFEHRGGLQFSHLTESHQAAAMKKVEAFKAERMIAEYENSRPDSAPVQ